MQRGRRGRGPSSDRGRGRFSQNKRAHDQELLVSFLEARREEMRNPSSSKTTPTEKDEKEQKSADSNVAEHVAENPKDESSEDTVSEESSDETDSEEESDSEPSSVSVSKTSVSLDSADVAAHEELECTSAAKNKENTQPAVKVFDKMLEQAECTSGKVLDKKTETENTTETKEKQAHWVSLFKDNRKLTSDLQIPTFEQQEKVALGENDLCNMQQEWGHILIGYIAGKFTGFKAIQDVCDSWKVKSRFIPHESGWLIFKFKDHEDMMEILQGSWTVFGRPLLLKKMPENFGFGHEGVSQTPVWVKLPSLPFSCWNATALGKITSNIGNPIAMDRLTQTKDRVSYARVLVEVDAAKELKDEVVISFPDGKEMKQQVIYEFKPKFCPSCQRIGHTECHGEKTDKDTIKAAVSRQPRGPARGPTTAKNKVVETGPSSAKDIPQGKEPAESEARQQSGPFPRRLAKGVSQAGIAEASKQERGKDKALPEDQDPLPEQHSKAEGLVSPNNQFAALNSDEEFPTLLEAQSSRTKRKGKNKKSED